MRPWFAVAFALTSPSVAAAQVVPAQAAAIEEDRLAVELASIFSPEALIRQAAETGMDAALDTLYADEPEFQDLERRSPGLLSELKAVLRPYAAKESVAGLPEYWAHLAPAYRSSMTDAQMREAIAFYRSDVGQTYLSTSAAHLDIGSLVHGRDGDWDSPFTTADIGRAVDPGDAAALAARSLADAAAFARFEQSSAGVALSKASVKADELGMEWLNRPDDDLDTVVDMKLEEIVSRRFPNGL